MKHILSIALIALVMGHSSMMPPSGDCKPGETWRCYQAGCVTTLLACPQVWEDGHYVIQDCNNQTSCNWDCSCVEKQPKEGE